MSRHRHRSRNEHRSPKRFDVFHQGRDDSFVTSDFSDRVFEPVGRSLPDRQSSAVDFDSYYIPSVRSPLMEVEDRRSYHPAGRLRPASSPRRHLSKIKVSNPLVNFRRGISAFDVPKMAFKVPEHVAICVRRKMRKEVMHALGKSGKGARHFRRPRRNEHSDVRC